MELTKKIGEQFDSLRQDLSLARDRNDQLRMTFIGHYQWLGEALHSQYHKYLMDRFTTFRECNHAVCSGIHRTIGDLKQTEKVLKEQEISRSPEVRAGGQTLEAS